MGFLLRSEKDYSHFEGSFLYVEYDALTANEPKLNRSCLCLFGRSSSASNSESLEDEKDVSSSLDLHRVYTFSLPVSDLRSLFRHGEVLQ